MTFNVNNDDSPFTFAKRQVQAITKESRVSVQREREGDLLVKPIVVCYYRWKLIYRNLVKKIVTVFVI